MLDPAGEREQILKKLHETLNHVVQAPENATDVSDKAFAALLGPRPVSHWWLALASCSQALGLGLHSLSVWGPSAAMMLLTVAAAARCYTLQRDALAEAAADGFQMVSESQVLEERPRRH